MFSASSAARAGGVFTRRLLLLLSSTRARPGPRAVACHTAGRINTRAVFWTTNQQRRQPMMMMEGGDRRQQQMPAPAEAATRRRTFSIYRPSRRDELMAAGHHVKVIHMVRHAQGTHNVEVPGRSCQYRNPKNHDARLTPFGEQQCEALAAKCADAVSGVQLVVTSPLTRCVQTALGSFPGLASRHPSEVPFVAHESVRETVNFLCDAHRPVSTLAAEFPRVDFSQTAEGPGGADFHHDRIWAVYDAALPEAYDGHRESADLVSVANRGREFFRWLGGREETEVAVSSHSAFQRCLFSFGQEGGVRGAPEQSLRGLGLGVPGAHSVDKVDKVVAASGGLGGGLTSMDDDGEDAPIVDYGEDEVFEVFMRDDWDNCEMRSFLVTY